MENFIGVRASELSGPALDWAVQISLWAISTDIGGDKFAPLSEAAKFITKDMHFSSSWMASGDLFDKYAHDMTYHDGWLVAVEGGDAHGTTKLEAFCRAMVAANLGDMVMIPLSLVRGE